MLELRAATSMAKLLRGLNRSDDAKLVLLGVRSRFAEHIVNPDLAEAQAILEELGG